eukprot:TRINITY_DN9074_c0_g1_i13.p1 TRINITY_DN9074_c0_g1~~TRINITY_DN9074_c0_g1_i13.p1  ORF type:complete len:246 (-),score=28.17 TRINITY_DN9074_c0_g1_i13:440-1177(-)
MLCTLVSTRILYTGRRTNVLLRIYELTGGQYHKGISSLHPGIRPQARTLLLCASCSSTPAHKNFSTTSIIFNQQSNKEEKVGSVVESAGTQSNNQVSTSFAEKTKDSARTGFYGIVIVAGVIATAVIAYTVLNELFSSNSPNALYDKAAKLCVEHPKVQDMLGEPIKVYGEEGNRRRRNRVSHLFYQDETGRKGIRIQFYLQGVRNRGVAQLDAREDSSGTFQTRFLLVNVEDFLRNTIIVQDNR